MKEDGGRVQPAVGLFPPGDRLHRVGGLVAPGRREAGPGREVFLQVLRFGKQVGVCGQQGRVPIAPAREEETLDQACGGFVICRSYDYIDRMSKLRSTSKLPEGFAVAAETRGLTN